MTRSRSVVIVGAGLAGLAGALAFADHGHEVRLLDREPDHPPLPPQQLADVWSRPSVPQAEQPHAFTSLGMNLLRERAPDVYRTLLEVGAQEIDLGSWPAGGPDLPHDPQLRLLGCRRKVFEAVLRRAVTARPRVTLHPATTVRGLLLAGGAPRVRGVRTDAGSFEADIVVDATGRRSLSARWLAKAQPAAAPAPTPAGGPGIAAYTRFYRLLTDSPPAALNRGNAAGGFWSHFSAILHPGDNGTFTICLGVLSDDPPLKALRHEAAFDAAVRSLEVLAPWVDSGTSRPISSVQAITFPGAYLRGPSLVAGELVQGLFPLGDAACLTNPVYGRGVSLALAHAYRLADVLDVEPCAGEEQAGVAAAVTESLMAPWHRQAERDDGELVGRWRMTVHAEQPPPAPTGRLSFSAVAAAGAADPMVGRRQMRVQMSLDHPDTLYTDPEIRDRVAKVLATGARPTASGPDREEFLEIVAAAG